MAKVLFEWDYSSYPGAKKYPNLFKPIQIGNLMVPNRIKYAATEDNLNDHHGYITDADVAYMRSRAEGVVGGLCFMQGVYMDADRKGQGYVGQAACWDDKFIPGLARIADAIHGERAVAGFQLMDCGRVGAVEVPAGHGPSTVPQRLRIFKPMFEMTKAEVKEMIKQHVDAAVRGVKAGFDVMEISGIVGYLLSNFISSYTNRRTDEYGGDIKGRMRASVEIIKGIKDALPDTPLGIRLCCMELLDDVRGNTHEESLESYRLAEEAGIDYLSVTAGWQESIVPVISRDVPMGSWLHLAKKAKETVKVPVQMAYRLFVPELPEKAIADGHLDIWEMCRPQIADPYMPKKVLEGKPDEIRHCVACNLCLARLFRDAPMTCYINPLCAHEHDPKFFPVPAAEDEKKKVMIVGAGPAGLEAAYVAAQRGHEVHVYDKRGELGGSLLEASKAPYGDEELMTCVTYQKTMCAKYGANLHLGTEVTPELIADEMPDAVILATGPVYSKPPAAEGAGGLVNVLDVLSGKAQVGDNVVVWGNRKPGIGVALHLAKQGKSVTIVGKEKSAGFDINPSFKWRYMIYLRQNKVNAYNDCDIVEMSDGQVIVKTFDGYRFPVKCDTVVVTEREANDALKQAVQAEGIQMYVIGDALVPRNLSSAVHDGYRIGLRV